MEEETMITIEEEKKRKEKRRNKKGRDVPFFLLVNMLNYYQEKEFRPGY